MEMGANQGHMQRANSGNTLFSSFKDIKESNEEAAVKRAEGLRDLGLLRGFGKARQVRALHPNVPNPVG